jgi:hypothetical protein
VSAVVTWPVLPPEQLPRDPWPHEHGDDTEHLLDASGHAPHHVEPTARLVGEPHRWVQRIRRPASPLASYLIGAEVLVMVVVALLAVAGSLPGTVG